MLTDGTIRTDKSQILQNKYIELVNNGIPSGEILVLCLNSYKKQAFLEKIENGITVEVTGKYNIQTFYGLCYNAINDNWADIENLFNTGEPSIYPNLCGLELSRFILMDSIDKGFFSDYFSKKNLIHQMFKRMQLMVLNSLTEKQVIEKSKILKETFLEDTIKVYGDFRRQTNKYRSFDYLRQVSVLQYIYNNTDYFSKIKYLLVDDADELSYAEFNFIKALKPQLKDYIIAYDGNGASRCGYLCAYKTAVFEFEKIFNEKPVKLSDNSLSTFNADLLYKNILNDKKTSFENFSLKSFVKRVDMLEEAFDKIKNLLKKGVQPKDILVITPILDDMTISFVNMKLYENYQVISGSEKFCDSNFLRNIFTLVKLIHKEWEIRIDKEEFRLLFSEILKIPLKYSNDLVSACYKNRKLTDIKDIDDEYIESYYNLKSFVEEISSDIPEKYSDEFIKIFDFLAKDGVSKDNLKKFNFFLKEIRSFENAYNILEERQKISIFKQFESGIIGENPSIPKEIDNKAIIFSTPQKVIDFEIKRKYHIWLDISSDLWTMRDIGVLYNSWVFNPEWEQKEFTFDDNLRLSKEKNARVLRKLMLCCDKEIFAYYSQYDSSGYENIGIMQSYFSSPSVEDKQKWQIIPRDDQRAVVEYNGGYAGVNAVPGAGKTTILIALLIKLLKEGVKAENIFVLTYMESAATNIREKIKSALPDLLNFPNVSTIHGLAFRIIKENNNYIRLNLPDNIEVGDENKIQKIIRECISELGLNHDDYDNYKRAISAVKLSPNGIKSLKTFKNDKSFYQLYERYEKKLRKSGIIDYDDMLRYSVELVTEHQDIRDYYSSLCRFVIEDEAQDSSDLQQKLLLILSEKHKNLLRIGDINQAITASFTDSNPKSFREYFKNNKQMVMKSSQRSSVQIQKLANSLIDFSKKYSHLKDAFYDSKLMPADKNPVVDKSPEFKIYNDFKEERYAILKKIKSVCQEGVDKSVAILVRNNNQVGEWASFLANNGLTVTTRADILAHKTVYQVIYAFLSFFRNPFSNKMLRDLMECLNKVKIICFSKEDFEYINTLNKPFILTNSDGLSEALTHLWWDLQFNDEFFYIPLDTAVIKLGQRYFKTQNEKQNVFLLSTVIKKLSVNTLSKDEILEKLAVIAQKPIGSSYKFFDEEDNSEVKVQVLTMHKSKGDEFDIVFIPEMSEDMYTLMPKETKVKPQKPFIELVKEHRVNYVPKTAEQLLQENMEETIRLLYVGFTRARKGLHISCSRKNRYNRLTKISPLFEEYMEAYR